MNSACENARGALRRALTLLVSVAAGFALACSDSPTESEPIARLTFTALTPATLARGASVTATLEGSGFTTVGTSVAIDGGGAGLTATAVQVVDSATLSVTLSAAIDAELGDRLLRVVRNGEATEWRSIRIVPGAPASLHILSGAEGADTIDANLPPLTVEVRDANGQTVPGATVLFESLWEGGFTPFVSIGVPPTWSFLNLTVERTTDPTGQTAASVRLTSVPGRAYVRVSVPSVPGLVDSTFYDIRTGSPWTTGVLPRSAALLVNGTTRFRAALYDRAGNVLSDTAGTFYFTGSAIADEGAGLARGATFGNAWAHAVFGIRHDSVLIAVVPDARLVARDVAGRALTLVNTTMSERREFLRNHTLGDPRVPAFVPGSANVVFDWRFSRLYISDTLGTARELPASPFQSWGLIYPQPSADGEWVFFTRADALAAPAYEVWRIRPNGTDASRVGLQGEQFAGEYHISPSPTADSVVYWTERAPSGLIIRDLLTDSTTPLGGAGDRQPRWSPRGDWIAVVGTNGHVSLVRPDGSARRTIAADAVGFAGPLAWSPDGVWLIGTRLELLEMINVDTEVRVRVPRSEGLGEYAWVFSR